jgi:hypothetical protein
MTKKDGSEKAGGKSCEKCEFCKMKSKDDHSMLHANRLDTDTKPNAGPKTCDCPCCNPKATDKNNKDEVVTVALMNY